MLNLHKVRITSFEIAIALEDKLYFISLRSYPYTKTDVIWDLYCLRKINEDKLYFISKQTSSGTATVLQAVTGNASFFIFLLKQLSAHKHRGQEGLVLLDPD